MKLTNLLYTFILVLFGTYLSAQISDVSYQLKYDTSTCRYDVHVILNRGQITENNDRIQFNSLVSIIVPTGSTMTIDESFMPLYNNADGNGTVPMNWVIGDTIVSPAAQPESDFYSVLPQLGTTSHYNPGIASGDTIKLFSITVSPMTNCTTGIRLFENGVDPASDAPGMQLSDFSQGFTMGSAEQLINEQETGVVEQVYPPIPVIVDVTNSCSGGIEIDITTATSGCQGPITYEWEGPAGFTSTDEDVLISPATTANNGDYSVTITDAFGCKDSTIVTVIAKPDAGEDQRTCAGETLNMQGDPTTNGTWDIVPNANPNNSVTLHSLADGAAQAVFEDIASGTYQFTYSITTAGGVSSCFDTMDIVVDPLPIVGLGGDSEICIGEEITLTSNEVGTWVSNNTDVATVVLATGVVTAVGQGTATFTFTNTATGCSATTDPLIVDPPPSVTVVDGIDHICINDFTHLTPTSGGNWVSSNTAVAIVSNYGVVLGVSAGTADMTFTQNNGCESQPITITVEPKPLTVLDDTDICVGGSTNISPNPNTEGTWATSDGQIATISNQGVISGISEGTVTFTFTNLAAGCVSDASETLTVHPAPTVFIAGEDKICVQSTTTLSPNNGGTWTANNPDVATVDPATGVVTSIAGGLATFTFEDATTHCTSTTEGLIVDPKPTASAEQDAVCIGGTTKLIASTSGDWHGLDLAVASLVELSSGWQVTGETVGVARFVFTEATTSCTSDTVTVEVEASTVVSIQGAHDICVGEQTTLFPSTGGVWISSNSNIATVNNDGVVFGITAGDVTFTFQDANTFCMSEPTDPITIRPRPIVDGGGGELCIDETRQLTPAVGGTWTSSNPAVATVTDGGLVVAKTPGFAEFTFKDVFNGGCESSPTAPITVNPIPEVSIDSDEICVSFTAQLSPSVGGTWDSSSDAVVTVTNDGVVTAEGPGTATLVYTSSSSECVSLPLTITVNDQPIVDIDGADELCIGETTGLSPNTGGTWSTEQGDIASVDPSTGVVTALSAGIAYFEFRDENGCVSQKTDGVTVNPIPEIEINGGTDICVGSTTTLHSNNAGTWASNDVNIATIDANTGVVTGVAAGTTTFTFVDGTTNCPSENSEPITVLQIDQTNLQANDVCIGQVTNITPAVGGVWESSDESIATITNAGIITAVSPGEVQFFFTSDIGCTAPASETMTVSPGPEVTIANTELCIDETTTLTPNAGGTWESFDPTVASVTDDGVVTALTDGLTYFTFTEEGTGCKSEPTDTLRVNPKPAISFGNKDIICIGETTDMLPNTGGTWTSTNTDIATIDANTGVVTGVATGTTTFIFTADDTNCPSDESGPLQVSPVPVVSIEGLTEICLGEQTTLTSGGIEGTWVSNDLSVATVDLTTGVVTSVAPGQVTFSFTETASGCESTVPTNVLTVKNCIDPDFNVTYVDVPVSGNANTNDEVPDGTTYGSNYVVTSIPGNSSHGLTIGLDGTYTFTGDTEGVYVFEVPVCVPPKVSGCQTSTLTITVLDYQDPENSPVANVDIATTNIGVPVTLSTLENDRCVISTSCSLDPGSVTVTSGPSHGGATVDGATGNITYTPEAGFTGQDTLTYSVCVDGELANCATSYQVITVNSGSALNSTVAADDFAVTPQEVPVSGNVSTNDNDPEGEAQNVTPLNVTVEAGTLTIAGDGSYTFTPADWFFGPVEFEYTTCDVNAVQACANATLHILVVRDLTINVRVYLQGSLLNSKQRGTTHDRPLMRDGLRVCKFTGANYIPVNDPYKVGGTLIDGPGTAVDPELNYVNITGLYSHVSTGTRAEFTTIPDPATVFSVTGEDAIVDWVFVQLRDKNDDQSVIATRSGLLQRDGDIVDLDGIHGLRFPEVSVDDYYVVVQHRNHLSAMSKFAQTPKQLYELVDFSALDDEGNNVMPVFDHGERTYGSGSYASVQNFTDLAQVKMKGVMSLWAGDFNDDGRLKLIPGQVDDDVNQLKTEVGFYPGNGSANTANTAGTTNFDFAFGYINGDLDMNGKAKFDNPNDDQNVLNQIVKFHRENDGGLANFDYAREQLPESD